MPPLRVIPLGTRQAGGVQLWRCVWFPFWPCHFLAVQPRERHATTLSLSFLICKGGHTDLKRGQGTHSRPSAHPPAETTCQESHRLQKTSRERPQQPSFFMLFCLFVFNEEHSLYSGLPSWKKHMRIICKVFKAPIIQMPSRLFRQRKS